MIARARSVVVIRRTGPGVKGSGPEAIVARAEVQLDAGDLAGAVETLSALQGKAAEAAEPWLATARAHIAALAAVGTLHRAALARIGAAKPPAAGSGRRCLLSLIGDSTESLTWRRSGHGLGWRLPSDLDRRPRHRARRTG